MADHAAKSDPGTAGAVRYPEGQHLHCHNCGAEVEIVTPCGCNPPDMVLQCCGQDMKPESKTG